jgi:hypothetical protein
MQAKMTTTQPLEWQELFTEVASLEGMTISEWQGEAMLERAAKTKGVTVEELKATLPRRLRRGERAASR